MLRKLSWLFVILFGLILVRPNLTAQAQTISPPFFGIATQHINADNLAVEFEQAKEAGLSGLVVYYDSVEALELAVATANAAEMQLLLFTEQNNPPSGHDYYANDAAFAMFQRPRLLTSLGQYRANNATYDGIMWTGSTQLTEIPENLTAAKKVVDEMYALRRRLLQSGHLWTVVISAESPDLPTAVNGALAVAPDAVIVANWESVSAEIRAEIEKPRTTLAEFNEQARAAASAPSNSLERIAALGGLALVLFVGGVIVARKEFA